MYLSWIIHWIMWKEKNLVPTIKIMTWTILLNLLLFSALSGWGGEREKLVKSSQGQWRKTARICIYCLRPEWYFESPSYLSISSVNVQDLNGATYNLQKIHLVVNIFYQSYKGDVETKYISRTPWGSFKIWTAPPTIYRRFIWHEC